MIERRAPPIYGYEAKWLWDSPTDPLEIFECPARLPRAQSHLIRTAALGAFHALECRDWCRVDIRCDATGLPMVVELNPLPGILPDPRDNSCFPKAARAAGLSYDELIRTVADIAWQRISGQRLLPRAVALNPGVTREQVQDNTGFKLEFDHDTGVTEPPTDHELTVLRELDPERLYIA